MKKLATILLCIVILISLAACGSESAKESPTASESSASFTQSGESTSSSDGGEAVSSRDTVYIGTDSDCGSLDPYVVSGSGFMIVMTCYAEPLWEYDGTTEGFASSYILAESVDTISDTEYIIHLREGVTFSNGSPFTASDVIFTLNHVINDTNRGYYIASVDVPKTIAEDDYTVHLYLSKYDKTQMTAFGSISMLDEETYNADTIGQNPIGTGPYVVTDYVVNSTVKLAARDDYWGGAPAIKNIVFKNIPEASQKINAIQTGEVDMLVTCPNSDAEYVDSLDGITTLYKTAVNQVSLTYNACQDSPLATKEARWAISYAVNSQGAIDVALAGIGNVAKGPFSASASDFSAAIADLHDTYKTGYNLELAKQYAQESGLVGKTVRLVTNGTDVYVTTAQIIEQSLMEIGVNAEVINLDQATVRNLIAGEADWEVYVSWIANPSGLGLDMIYAQISKFGRAHFDYDTENFTMFSDMGVQLLATSDPTAYNALLLEYMNKFEEFCYVYGVADMDTIRAASDSLAGIVNVGYAYDHVSDWYFVN